MRLSRPLIFGLFLFLTCGLCHVYCDQINQSDKHQKTNSPTQNIKNNSTFTPTITSQDEANSINQHIATDTFWLAVITGLLFVATCFLAYYSRKQIVEIRENSRRELRAYLSVTPNTDLKWNKTPIPNMRHIFYFDITNFGQTPANNFIFKARVDCLEKGPQKEDMQKLGDGVSGIATVNPLQVIRHSTPERIFTPIELHNWQTGKLKIMIFGVFRYKDVFSVVHEFEFCFQLDETADGQKVLSASEGFNRTIS